MGCLRYTKQRLRAEVGTRYIDANDEMLLSTARRAGTMGAASLLARRLVLRSMEKERKRDQTMLGFGEAIDRMATSELHTTMDARRQGILWVIFVGGVFPNHRRALCDKTCEQNSDCPRCGLPETVEDLWWECPAYEHLRLGLRVWRCVVKPLRDVSGAMDSNPLVGNILSWPCS